MVGGWETPRLSDGIPILCIPYVVMRLQLCIGTCRAYVWLFHANKAASSQVGAGISSNITMRIASQHDADSQETSLYQHRCERLTLPGGGLFCH
mgnify:CR=1 FL=1